MNDDITMLGRDPLQEREQLVNLLMLPCGLSYIGGDYSYCGIAKEGETPYDFSTRLLSMGYTNVTTVPLWRLPQFPRAWQQFTERNQCARRDA